MAGNNYRQTGPDRLRDDLRTDYKRLDSSCRRYAGVSAQMFRALKFVFYIATLAFSGYLIEVAAVEPFIAMTFAALLITGPEGAETFLIRQGVIDDDAGADGDAGPDDG